MACESNCFASQDEPRNVRDAKNICRWSVMSQAPQSGGDEIFRFDQVGGLAANILARAGVYASVDPSTGRVDFSDEREEASQPEAIAA